MKNLHVSMLAVLLGAACSQSSDALGTSESPAHRVGDTSDTSNGLDGVTAATQQLLNMVSQQASVLSFVDVFVLLTVLFGGLGLFALLMNKPAPVGGAAGGH